MRRQFPGKYNPFYAKRRIKTPWAINAVAKLLIIFEDDLTENWIEQVRDHIEGGEYATFNSIAL